MTYPIWRWLKECALDAMAIFIMAFVFSIKIFSKQGMLNFLFNYAPIKDVVEVRLGSNLKYVWLVDDVFPYLKINQMDEIKLVDGAEMAIQEILKEEISWLKVSFIKLKRAVLFMQISNILLVLAICLEFGDIYKGVWYENIFWGGIFVIICFLSSLIFNIGMCIILGMPLGIAQLIYNLENVKIDSEKRFESELNLSQEIERAKDRKNLLSDVKSEKKKVVRSL